jgi:hypothetical protein
MSATPDPDAPSRKAEHPADGSPGTTSSPEGKGPDLAAPGAAARMSPKGPTPDSNQGKTEPVPPDGGQDVAATVATGNPQGHRLPGGAASGSSLGGTADPGAAGSGRDPAHAGAPVGDETAIDTGHTTRATGETPRQDTAGEAFRARGSMGASADPFAADTVAGAAATAPGSPPGSAPAEEQTPGDLGGVSATTTEPMEGTTEESAVVRGARPTVPAGSGFQATRPGGQQVSGSHRPSSPDGEVASE